MLGVVGAWAQETPVLTYENVTAPKDITSDATTILGLSGMTFVADVTITTSSDAQLLFAAVADYTSSNTANNSIWGLGLGGNSLRYIVGPRTGGWYSSDNGSLTTNAKKIIFTYDGTNIKYYVDGTWVKDQSSTKALNTFTGANAKLYLGGVVYNSSTEWGKFSGTISKVEIYNRVFSDIEIAEMCYPQEVVINPDRFENGRIYTFETSLGWMGARESDNNAISTALASNNATGSADNTYFQWAVYKSDKDNYYIYNVGKGMFLGEQSTTGNASVPMSNTPAIVTFKATLKGGYPLMFKTTDNANCVVNHSKVHGSGLITWNGGWNKTLDNGNCHIITDVGELDNDILATIKNAVDAYEAVAALSEAISTVEGWVVSNVGVGVGKYTYYGDGTFETKIQGYKDYRDGITEKNNPAPAEVEAKIVEINALLASFTLNIPEAGKFYRFKNNESSWYATSDLRTGQAQHSNKLYMKEDGTTASTIWYLTAGNKLLSFTKGRYLGDMNTDWSFESVGSEGNVVSFNESAVVGKYQILPSIGRALYGDKIRVDAAPSSNNSGNYAWIIEEVTSLPITIGESGYATFYSPIAVTLPDGLKAYYVSKTKGSYAKMEEINDVIPANTGVILEGTPNTYNLTIGGTAESVTNKLSGTVVSEYRTDDAYVLSMPTIDGVVQPVGFYKATKNQQSNTAWLNNGFKAYLPATAVASESRFLVFDFGDDMETGITETENGNVKTENYEVYDLAGRRVQNAQKGIFIVNGKMVVR